MEPSKKFSPYEEPQKKAIKTPPMGSKTGCIVAVGCCILWVIALVLYFGNRRFSPDEASQLDPLIWLPMVLFVTLSLINIGINYEYKNALKAKEITDIIQIEQKLETQAKIIDALSILGDFIENNQDTSNATVLGLNKHTERPIVVTDLDRQSGMYCLGVQGVGKSSLLEQVIFQDISKGYSVLVLDPHGDLIDHVVAQMPKDRLKDAYLLDIEDVAFPFGLNLFNVPPTANSTQQQQAHDRVLHVFEKCFPDTSHMYLEKYIGNIAPTFFANSQAGYGMTDIPRFLRDDTFRGQLVKNARFFIREFWLNDFNSMTPSKRQEQTASLAIRINRFMRSPIVGNIIGQSNTTIDFRKAIESKQILLIRLPVKTLPQDASLIGTMLVAQIHAAIFSFGDLPLEQRPGFSLFVDEFQHFATSDFAEMFTEGRKFGSRVCVAHQFTKQLTPYLVEAANAARTKICFETTPDDGGKMAPLFLRKENTLRKEDINPKPIDYLLTYGHSNPAVEKFIKEYLRPIDTMRSGNHILVMTWESSIFNEKYFGLEGRVIGGRMIPLVPSPLPLLNAFLYEVEAKGNADLPIPQDIILGFSNMGVGYYKLFRKASPEKQRYIASKEGSKLSNLVRLKQELSDERGAGVLLDMIRQLREVMVVLAKNPIGERKALTSGDMAQEIINLPRRTAFVKIGTDIATLQTQDTPPAASNFVERKQGIIQRTRKTYCRPASVVEQEIEKRQQSII